MLDDIAPKTQGAMGNWLVGAMPSLVAVFALGWQPVLTLCIHVCSFSHCMPTSPGGVCRNPSLHERIKFVVRPQKDWASPLLVARHKFV